MRMGGGDWTVHWVVQKVCYRICKLTKESTIVINILKLLGSYMKTSSLRMTQWCRNM